jgi:alpha-ketoglutarate-dependent taurine dioxygenase
LPKATLLSARKISEAGGQTEFANLFAAYEGLPEDEKAAIDDLRVVHSVYSSVRPLLSFDVTPENWGGPPNAKEHPLVWKHSSGRKSLVLGTHAESVVGMTLPEGRALLARLLEWAGQPDYTYRHHWTVGDFVVWNNTAALHRVLPYDKSSGRMMHRTSIAGVEMVE